MKRILIFLLLFFYHFISIAYSQATISGRVFNDISGNNSYDAGEELNNITVWLLDLNAVAPYYMVSPVQTANTNASGNYLFSAVPAGDYQVRVSQTTIPPTISRAVYDNDAYPNGVTQIMGVSGSNTYANIDFGFAPTAIAPSFTSQRNFQWNASNTFYNQTSKTFNLSSEIVGGNTINPTITWSTDKTSAPDGGYFPNTYPQASYSSAVLGQDYPGANKGGIHPADNTFQLIFGGNGYTPVNNDRQTTTIQFNYPVVHTKFSIYDIDHADPQVSTGRIDHVKVTGYFGSSPVMPVLLNPSVAPWNTVSGNTVYGFSDYPLTAYTPTYNSGNEDHGTVNVYFGNTIDRIVVEYEEWCPVILPGKGINDATPPNLATNEASWSLRTTPTYRGIGIGSIDYTIDTATILPLRLTDFKAVSKNCSILLNWETSFEENVEVFEVEYSPEGRDFQAVGRVTPENNSNGSKYSFPVSHEITSGYFRLKMQDVDGKIQYSDIRAVTSSCNNLIWSFTDNPVIRGKKAIINLTNKNGSLKKGNLVLWDLASRQLLLKPLLLQPGQNSINLETLMLKAGIYLIGITDQFNSIAGNIQKLIVQ